MLKKACVCSNSYKEQSSKPSEDKPVRIKHHLHPDEKDRWGPVLISDLSKKPEYKQAM
jgi:hypothetical protein